MKGGMKPFCAPVNLNETFRIYYNLGLPVMQYILPLMIISIAYAKMAARLWGLSLPGNKQETRDVNALRNKRRVRNV